MSLPSSGLCRGQHHQEQHGAVCRRGCTLCCTPQDGWADLILITAPLQYAAWEEKQKDFRRARSVFERALDVNYNAPNIWLKYAEMEMRHRFVNHARNVWDRAVTLMPRVDQLWWVLPASRCVLQDVLTFQPHPQSARGPLASTLPASSMPVHHGHTAG